MMETVKKKILVIEDNPGVLENVEEILIFEGFSVYCAEDGLEGLRLARKEKPDLIISDMMMPGMEGMSVLKELRGSAEGARVPFLFLSARASREDIRAGMNLGADDYLTKPFTIDELLETVRALFAKKEMREMEPNFVPLRDPETGLRTGAALEKDFQCFSADRKKFAAIYIEIQRLPSLCMVLEQEAAANLRREVAGRLSELQSDEVVLYGLAPGEFCYLAFGLDAKSAVELGKRAQRLLTEARGELIELSLSATSGIALYPLHAQDTREILRNAVLAARRSNVAMAPVLFDPEMSAQAESNVRLEKALRKAQDREELFVLYQPKIDLETGRLRGVEALLRWTHADLGPISPARFIPLAEETGMIDQLGVWVLKTACLQIVWWQSAGHSIPVAVNVSSKQLQHDRFVTALRLLLQQFQIDPGLLELEITESVLAERDVIRRCADLKKLGVKLAMDDFGTGYSSLSYLKELPLDTVKIDRSFVRDLPDDPSGRTVCHALVSLTHSLGMQTVAEGVENKGQADFLRLSGCDIAQGFLYSPAVPPEKILEFANSPEGAKEKAKACV